MKVRFVLKSFNENLIKEALRDLTLVLANIDGEVSGFIALPGKLKRFCVIRSPHIDKASREHFEIRSYKHFFDISVKTPEKLNLLLQTTLPSGVSCFLEVLES